MLFKRLEVDQLFIKYKIYNVFKYYNSKLYTHFWATLYSSHSLEIFVFCVIMPPNLLG